MSATHSDPFGWVGQTIDGKFRVEAVVGEGGFGVVYRAQHLGLGELVAVKCLKVPAALSPEDRERFHQSFLEEGRILRRLSRLTAAVVQALDVGAANSPRGGWTPYLVLEWLRGSSLEDHLLKLREKGRAQMALESAFELLEPAAMAIASAHDEGIAHRDIKPANFFTTDVDGMPSMKVLDFGIAKVIADNASITRAFEQTGQTPSMFTPFYGAPEQFNRRFGATGPWTDVFALALVLVEMVTGKAALDGDDATQLYIAATDVSIRPTPRMRGVATSDAVEAVFLKALAVEPKSRYTSARAFWKELREALPAPVENGRRNEDASLPPTISSNDVSRRTTTPHVGSTRPASHASRRSLLAIVGSLLIITAFVGASLYIRNRATAKSVNTANRIGVESLLTFTVPKAPDEMVLIPAGSFVMGHANAGETEKPAHTVVITRAFYIDRMEVTASDYAKCVNARKCLPSSVHGPGVDDAVVAKFSPFCTGNDANAARKPINCIDYAQAEAYCAFVEKRLPTEAEWEYAARGTDERVYPWGNTNPSCLMGNFGRNAGECAGKPRGTVEVGSFPEYASPFGALDMSGNVWEWVADVFDPKAYTQETRRDPYVKKPGDKGVLRGGSWDFSTTVAKTTFRLKFDRHMGQVSTGVRCAKHVTNPAD
jgi:eukaryotic-like serine/threonine-protein kinase